MAGCGSRVSRERIRYRSIQCRRVRFRERRDHHHYVGIPAGTDQV